MMYYFLKRLLWATIASDLLGCSKAAERGGGDLG